MREPDAARRIDLLARLPHGARFSIGFYCQEEARCHRPIVPGLLREQGAVIID